ncbi:MAG: ABC transporter permease [Spirochaetaceae bacterium]|jgi:simple sugar transport system permease protein|nr:ABC transporter permease [Spirochaetaceae bacterium]
MKFNNYLNTLFSIIIAFVIGGIIVLFMGYNPLTVYSRMIRGAFSGSFNFGGTLEKFVPMFLTAIAFYMSTVVNQFNVGVEGQMYLGAIAAAWVGFSFTGIPAFFHSILCFSAAITAGGLWALVPAILKTSFKVNEICTTILLNYVAVLFTSYLVNGPLSAGKGIATTPFVSEPVFLPRILEPSRANMGLFIALFLFILLGIVLSHTTMGFRLRSTGTNAQFSEYVGINTRAVILAGMFASGAIGGIAGGIQVLGVHHAFLDGFSSEIASFGMLAALISGGNYKMLPVMSLLLAALKNGALGMQRFTDLKASLVDVIIAVFILITAMNWIKGLGGRKKGW